MKIVVVNNLAFATHSKDQEIIISKLYPSASDLLIVNANISPLGSTTFNPDGTTTTIPPMTKDEILAVMTPEELATSELATAGITNTTITLALAAQAIDSESIEMAELSKKVKDVAQKYKLSVAQVMGALK